MTALLTDDMLEGIETPHELHDIMAGVVAALTDDEFMKLIDGIDGIEAKSRQIFDYDMGSLEQSLEGMALHPNETPECFWKLQDVPGMIRGFRRWLFVAWVGERLGLMAITDKAQDAAWHVAMQRPAFYAQLCQDIFGRLVDHEPVYILSGEGFARLGTAVAPTKRLEQLLFGEVVSEADPRCGQACLFVDTADVAGRFQQVRCLLALV